MLKEEQKERILEILTENGKQEDYNKVLSEIKELDTRYLSSFDPRSNMVMITDTIFFYLGHLYENYICDEGVKPCDVCEVKEKCENAECEEYLMLCCAEFIPNERWTIRQIPW